MTTHIPQILIISAGFYKDISAELIKGAAAALTQAGAEFSIEHVPGAFEIPAAIAIAAGSHRFDGFVALGCVIRGETSHYDYVCAESARGIMQLSVEKELPIGYGILTVENEQQAWARARVLEGNKGRDAALACLRMLELKRLY